MTVTTTAAADADDQKIGMTLDELAKFVQHALRQEIPGNTRLHVRVSMRGRHQADRDEAMTNQPESLRNLEQAAHEAQKGLAQAGAVFAAQGAMGWAYRGDIDGARAALAGMGPDQLRELSSAASMLAALADEELSSR